MSGFPVQTLPSSNDNFRVYKLSLWREAKAAFEAAQANERALRKEVIELFSEHAGENDMFKGTENVETGIGQVKMVHKIDYKVTTDDDKLDAALEAIEKSQLGGNVIADRLIVYKAELSVSEYNKLTDAQRQIIDRVITAKPASKELKFTPVVGQ